MEFSARQLAVFLIVYYGILDAHLLDVHFRSAEEEAMMETYEQEKENDEARETLNDEDATPEEKEDALNTLYDNGKFA